MGLLHQHHARQVVEVIVEASALASAMDWWGSGSRCSIVEAIVEALASCSTSTTSALASAMDWWGSGSRCSIVEALARLQRSTSTTSAVASAMDWWGSGSRCSIVEALASCSTSTTSALASAMESRAAGGAAPPAPRPPGRRGDRRGVGPRVGDGLVGLGFALLHRRGAGQLLHQHHARQVVEVIVEASALASAMDWWGSGSRCSIVEALASCSTSTTSALASAMDWWGSGWRLLHRRGDRRGDRRGVGPRIGDGLVGLGFALLHRRGAGQLLHQHHARQVVEVIVEASALASAMDWWGSGSRCSIVEAIVEVLASCSTSTTSALASAMESRAAGWGCSTSTTPARSSR